MAEIALTDEDNHQEMAQELLKAAGDRPEDVVWSPRPDTPRGGVFVVPDELAERFAPEWETRRQAKAEEAAEAEADAAAAAAADAQAEADAENGEDDGAGDDGEDDDPELAPEGDPGAEEPARPARRRRAAPTKETQE